MLVWVGLLLLGGAVFQALEAEPERELNRQYLRWADMVNEVKLSVDHGSMPECYDAMLDDLLAFANPDLAAQMALKREHLEEVEEAKEDLENGGSEEQAPRSVGDEEDMQIALTLFPARLGTWSSEAELHRWVDVVLAMLESERRAPLSSHVADGLIIDYGCPRGGWTAGPGGACYHASPWSMNASAAGQYCRDRHAGATLASLHSDDDRSVADQLLAVPGRRAWVGMGAEIAWSFHGGAAVANFSRATARLWYDRMPLASFGSKTRQAAEDEMQGSSSASSGAGTSAAALVQQLRAPAGRGLCVASGPDGRTMRDQPCAMRLPSVCAVTVDKSTGACPEAGGNWTLFRPGLFGRSRCVRVNPAGANLTWAEAKAACEALAPGGVLAAPLNRWAISNATALVAAAGLDAKAWWMGAFGVAHSWAWTDRTSFDYSRASAVALAGASALAGGMAPSDAGACMTVSGRLDDGASTTGADFDWEPASCASEAVALCKIQKPELGRADPKAADLPWLQTGREHTLVLRGSGFRDDAVFSTTATVDAAAAAAAGPGAGKAGVWFLGGSSVGLSMRMTTVNKPKRGQPDRQVPRDLGAIKLGCISQRVLNSSAIEVSFKLPARNLDEPSAHGQVLVATLFDSGSLTSSAVPVAVVDDAELEQLWAAQEGVDAGTFTGGIADVSVATTGTGGRRRRRLHQRQRQRQQRQRRRRQGTQRHAAAEDAGEPFEPQRSLRWATAAVAAPGADAQRRQLATLGEADGADELRQRDDAGGHTTAIHEPHDTAALPASSLGHGLLQRQLGGAPTTSTTSTSPTTSGPTTMTYIDVDEEREFCDDVLKVDPDAFEELCGAGATGNDGDDATACVPTPSGSMPEDCYGTDVAVALAECVPGLDEPGLAWCADMEAIVHAQRRTALALPTDSLSSFAALNLTVAGFVQQQQDQGAVSAINTALCSDSYRAKNETTRLEALSHYWTWSGAVFFSMTVLTTIGYGAPAPTTTASQAFVVGYALVGIGVAMFVLDTVARMMLMGITSLAKKVTASAVCARVGACRKCASRCSFQAVPASSAAGGARRRRRSNAGATGAAASAASGANTMTSVNEELVWSTAAFLVLTLVGGWLAVLLSPLDESGEHTWDYWSAVYWCVVTLTTLGFGDIVPAPGAQTAFALVFVLLGLGVVSMFFSAVAAKVEEMQLRKQRQMQRTALARAVREGAAAAVAAEFVAKTTGGARRSSSPSALSQAGAGARKAAQSLGRRLSSLAGLGRDGSYRKTSTQSTGATSVSTAIGSARKSSTQSRVTPEPDGSASPVTASLSARKSSVQSRVGAEPDFRSSPTALALSSARKLSAASRVAAEPPFTPSPKAIARRVTEESGNPDADDDSSEGKNTET